MPAGNAHMLPSGLWWKDPPSQSYKPYILKSIGKVFIAYGIYFAYCQFRRIGQEVTYTNFIGKTMVYGRSTVLEHEPFSAAEIDKLKEEQAARRAEARSRRLRSSAS